MPDCIFCKIVRGEIPSRAVHTDADVIAIEDVNPQAPVHLLVMPARHYANLGELVGTGNDALVVKLLETAAKLGRERGGPDGYRLAVNTGPNGGQTVDHLHVHVFAGRPMTWPPG